MAFSTIDDNGNGKSTKELIQQIENENGVLPQGLNWNDATKVVKSIMISIERLFEEAAIHLDAKGLLSFVKTLCQASQQQLFSISSSACTNDGALPIPILVPATNLVISRTSLHLHQLGQYLLRCTHISGRPLAHLMKAWYEVSPHFIKVTNR